MIRVREPNRLPHDAIKLISALTEKKPEDRMTVREAQSAPWVSGSSSHNSEDTPYVPPTGDFPSDHGDPVVALECAAELSNLTKQYLRHKAQQT